MTNVCRFRVPKELHSDKGRNVESRFMKGVVAPVNKEDTYHPLHSQTDGMVERYVKTVKEHIRKVVWAYQRDWDDRHPILMLAY